MAINFFTETDQFDYDETDTTSFQGQLASSYTAAFAATLRKKLSPIGSAFLLIPSMALASPMPCWSKRLSRKAHSHCQACLARLKTKVPSP